MKQELLTLPGNMNSRPVFSGVRVAQSLVFCVVYCGSLFVIFFLVIAFYFLRFTASNYPFGIVKLFSHITRGGNNTYIFQY